MYFTNVSRAFSTLFAAASLLASLAVAAKDGITSDTILVGQSAVLAGPLSATSLETQRAAQLYFDKINSEGGVFGRRIKLIALDDGLNPERAAQNYKKLIEDEQVFAMFLGTGTAPTEAALPILSANKVPMIAPIGVADSVRAKSGSFVYYTRAGYAAEAEKIMQHLSVTSLETVAVISINNPGGKEVALNVESQLAKRNKRLVAPSQYVELNGSNVAQVAKEVAAAQPQAVVLFATGAAGGNTVKELQANNFRGQIYAFSLVSAETLFKAVGEKGTGTIFTQVFHYPWDKSIQAVREYQQIAFRNNLTISYNTFGGFLSAKLMVDALRRAGSNPTRDKFVAGLQRAPFDLDGIRIDFTKGQRNGSRQVDIVRLSKDGKFAR
jgi:branched-chain amino acid transport system substrate-binding protein